MSRKFTKNEFIEKSMKHHGNKYDYSNVEYKGKEEKVCIICPIHGEFWQRASLHMNGSGCPKCSYIDRQLNMRKRTERFIEQSKNIHGNKYDYSLVDYKNAHIKVKIICPTHGEFEMRPYDHLHGKGCPICKQSHLERCVMVYFQNNNIEFEQQKRFDWLGKQTLDFYLPQYNVAIECQGKQHFGYGGWSENFDFDEQINRDEMKYKLCEENNIKILYFCDKHYVNQSVSDIYNDNNIIFEVNKLLFS